MALNRLRNYVRDFSGSTTEIISAIESEIDAIQQNISGSGAGVNGVLLVNTTSSVSYDTIGEAIAASSAGDFISIGPGVWDESFIIPPNVIVKGATAPRDVVIRGEGGAAHTGSIVTLSDSSTIRDVLIQTPTDGGAAVTYTGSANAIVTQVSFAGRNSGICVENNGPGQLLGLTNTYLTGDCDNFMRIRSGTAVFDQTNLVNGSFDKIYLFESTGSCLMQNVLTVAGQVSASTGIEVASSGSLTFLNGYFSGTCDTGFHVSSESASIYLNAMNFQANTWDVLIDSDITGIGSAFSNELSDIAYERLSFSQAYADNATVNAVLIDRGVQNDQAFRILDELSVGSTARPRESSFGEGDSTVNGMTVFGSSSAGGFVDNTLAAKINGSPSYTLLPALVSGTAAYFSGGNRMVTNCNHTIATAQVGPTGLWEFWNGSGWEEMRAMSAFSQAERQQVRFDIGMTGSWQTNTVNGVEGYWFRYALTSSITTSPVITRTKMGTNRTEINPCGCVEYFGLSEPLREIPWRRTNEDDVSGFSPSNETVQYSSNISLTPVDCEFVDNSLDGNGGIVAMPEAIDTSRPLIFEIVYYSKSNGSPSNIELEMTVAQVREGDVIGAIQEQALSNIETIGTSDQNRIKRSRFEIDIDKLVPGEFIAFRYFRDARAGNADDTLAGNIVIVETRFLAYFHR